MAKRRWASRPEFDREVFNILRAIRGKTDKEVAEKSFVSPQTVHRMRIGPRYGGTRFPQHLTLKAIARAVGLDYKLVDQAEVDAENVKLRAEVARLEREMKEAHKIAAARKAKRAYKRQAKAVVKVLKHLAERNPATL